MIKNLSVVLQATLFLTLLPEWAQAQLALMFGGLVAANGDAANVMLLPSGFQRLGVSPLQSLGELGARPGPCHQPVVQFGV